MYVCVFIMGCLQLVVPEGTTDWRCACKGVPDMHLAFVLTKLAQFRSQKQIDTLF